MIFDASKSAEPALVDEPAAGQLIRPVLLAIAVALAAMAGLVLFSVHQIDETARSREIGYAKALISAYADRGVDSVAAQLSAGGFLDAHAAADSKRTPGGVILPVVDSNGLRLGYVGFAPFRPGLTTLQATILPKLAVLFACFASVAVLLAKMHRETRRIEDRRRQAREMALTDSLSGLANRRRLSGFLSAALADAEQEGQPLCLLLLDLDGFKRINDTYGHAAGDRLIRSVGERLSSLSENGDLVARLSGDEFCFVRPGIGSNRAAAELAGRLIAAFEVPFVLAQHRVHVGASIGLVQSDQILAPEGSDLLRAADAALYAAKGAGRNRFVPFSADVAVRFSADRGKMPGANAAVSKRGAA